MITKKEIKESNLNPEYIKELGEAIAKEGQKDAMDITYISEKAGIIERFIIRLKLIQERDENEEETVKPTLAQENNAISRIFERIKGTAENYLNQGYPAAPDPDQYVEMIEEQIKDYDALKAMSPTIIEDIDKETVKC